MLQQYYDDEFIQKWEHRDPQNFAAGSKDARNAIDRGILDLKMGVDIADHAVVELLLQHDVYVELCGDVLTSGAIGGRPGMRPIAYAVAYNREMVREIDRRFGRETALTWSRDGDDLEQQRRRQRAD